MQVIDILQTTIDYIEDNLKTELIPDELAKDAGFSTYHFYHLFGVYLGMPVLAYITKRRLKHAVFEAQMGKKSLVSLALEYDFDTHAGFYKAFRREYGCSPKKYLQLASVKKPMPLDLKKVARIMLTQTQIKQLLAHWDIDAKGETITHFGPRPDSGWHIGEQYQFKSGTNISGLRTHIDISRALQTQGLTAAWPIKTKDGQDFLVIDDRYYALLNRIQGNALSTEERYHSDRIETGKKYGRAIASLHQVLEAETDNIQLNDRNIYRTVMDWALPETKRIMEQWGVPLPQDFYDQYSAGFEGLYPHLTHHLIHRDANPGNIIFNNGDVAGFIDFEISEKNIRLFDPCYCATGILSEAGSIDSGFDHWPELLTGVIRGYDEVAHLSPIEKEAIPYVIYSIQMIFIAWLAKYDHYKELAIINRRMLLWIWENREQCFAALK